MSFNIRNKEKIKRQLISLTDFMTQCKLYSELYIAMALTKSGIYTKLGKISHGDGTQLTEAEITADTLNTALNHIHNFTEAADKKMTLMNELDELDSNERELFDFGTL